MKYQLVIYRNTKEQTYQIPLHLQSDAANHFFEMKLATNLDLTKSDLFYIILSYREQILNKSINLYHAKHFKKENQEFLVNQCSLWNQCFHGIELTDDDKLTIPEEIFAFEEIQLYHLLHLFNHLDWDIDKIVIKKRKGS